MYQVAEISIASVSLDRFTTNDRMIKNNGLLSSR